MRISFLEIESFRGYGEKYSFSFPNSNVILLYGQNGNGKTSFFDAIEWCLTGSITRYETTSDERRRTKFIGNKFSENIPQVNLILSINEIKIHIYRYGSKSFGKLTDYGQENTHLKVIINESETFYDSEAEKLLSILLINEQWRSRINLQRGLALTNILGQEQMDSLIRGTKDKDRYNNLSVLFGTQHFQNKYIDAFQEIKKSIVSKNEENQRALNIIEELLGQLNLELQKNDTSIPDNISENLKESYIRQQKKIKNLDISNQPIPEVQIIKSNLAKDQTFVNNYLTTYENTWNKTNNALYAFERWKKQQPRLIKLLELQSIVRQVEFEQRQEKDITWLMENSVRYFEADNKLITLNTSIEAKKREIEYHEFLISVLSESQKQMLAKNTLVQSSIIEESFNSENLVSQLQKLDISYDLSFQIKKILDELKASLIKQRVLEQKKIVYSDELKDNENLLKQIKDLDNDYHQLLILIQNYAKKNPDVSTCPACGTNNISSDHLLVHTLHQQNTSHPDLNRLSTIVEDSKLSYEKIEKEISETKKDYTLNLLEFKNIIDELTKLIESVHQALLFTNKECELLQKEIDFLRVFNSDFIDKSKSLKLIIKDTNISTLKELLNNSLSQINLNKSKLIQTQDNLLSSCELNNTNDIDIVVLNVKNNQEVSFDSFRDVFEVNSIENIDEHFLSISFNSKIEELKLEKKQIDNWKIANDELSISIKQMEAFEHSKSLKTQIDSNEKKQKNLIEKRSKLKKDLEVIEAAIKSTPITIDKLNENVMDELFEDISKIYQRISPHPLFTNFKYDKNSNFKANRLLYSVSENDGSFANPSFIFSSAQVNGAALSIFLAMAMKQEWTPLSLIAMDDPIQSMDDLNTSFLVDFIRELTKHSTAKQFIISTHDINFYRLMLKKFRYQNLSTLEFEGLTKNGPILTMNSGKAIRTHMSQSLSKGKLELNKLFEDILKNDEEDKTYS